MRLKLLIAQCQACTILYNIQGRWIRSCLINWMQHKMMSLSMLVNITSILLLVLEGLLPLFLVTGGSNVTQYGIELGILGENFVLGWISNFLLSKLSADSSSIYIRNSVMIRGIMLTIHKMKWFKMMPWVLERINIKLCGKVISLL